MRLKPLHEQVIVITGATSGIGLVTARKAALAGARLVLAARSEDALRRLKDQIATVARVEIVVADVGDEAQVEAVAEAAMARFGRIDTWVNNAGVSIYGEIMDVATADLRRLFDTNVWGVVYGSRAAAKRMRGRGGAIVNLGSVLSDRAIPLQGIYSASKHAVKGFTDALRMELEHEGAGVSVTLIKPSAIDTPYVDHARNYLPQQPSNPPPAYDPELVAKAILHAATHPVRDLVVGGGGWAIAMLGTHAPRLTDWIMEKTMWSAQQSGAPAHHRTGALRKGGGGLRGRGEGDALRTSPFTAAQQAPGGALVGLAAALALGGWLGARAARRR